MRGFIKIMDFSQGSPESNEQFIRLHSFIDEARATCTSSDRSTHILASPFMVPSTNDLMSFLTLGRPKLVFFRDNEPCSTVCRLKLNQSVYNLQHPDP